MKKGFAKIAVVLDRSGSMESIRADTVGGFNAFIDKQRQSPGTVAVSLFQFDNEYETVYDFAPLAAVKPLTLETFVPRGSTALHDAIGRSVTDVGRRLSDMPESERPESVVFLIVTDGLENSSRQYGARRIREMITHQRDAYKWQFVFIGANQDAVLSAETIGIDAGHAMTYASTAGGVRDAYETVSIKMSHHHQLMACCSDDSAAAEFPAFDDADRARQRKEMGGA